MSITRLQQARQMYAMGQRVAKTLDGSRPGFGGGADMGTVSGTTKGSSANKDLSGGYQGGPKGETGQTSDGGGDPGKDPPVTSDNIDDIVLTSKDYKKHARKFDVGVAGGLAKNQVVGPYGPYKPGYNYQPFLDYRPQVNIPNLGILGMAANFAKKPIQAFADFTASKNRPYFMDEVVRAGKYTLPDGTKLDYGTVSEMTNQELEAAYKGYLSDRLSGKTDAYGNPNPGYNSGGGGPDQGIATIYNNMFDDSQTENPSDPFASRYLQNQPDDIREEIESRMQDYYTV